MGNAGSSGDAAEDAALTRVETLRDQLADMERAVRMLSNVPQQIDVLLPHQARIHGHAVACDPDVRVLLGPVVGKVDCQSARVLLEIDRVTVVTCHVLIFDTRTEAFVEVPHSNVRITATPARRPAVFYVQSLLPGRQYRVVFSGIHRDDARRCTGSFRTPSGAGDLQCAVVSADDVHDLECGERSLWTELKRRIVDDRSVQLVLHLGGQVAMKRMFDKAWTLLVRHAECMAPPAIVHRDDTQASVAYAHAWKALEGQAMEIVRSAYRTQWTLVHDKASVLANASNLMMWSDWDVYPAFTTSPVFIVDHTQPTLEMQVLRTVVRCARRAYHEYQRALWDDELDELFAQQAELDGIAEQALAATARLHLLSQQQIPVAHSDLDVHKKRRDIEAARKAERHLRALEAKKAATEKTLVSYNQLLAPQRGEELVYQVGSTAIVLLDMRSARVEPGGSQRAESELLSNMQWDFVERVLEDDAITLLHICCEAPLVDDLPHALRVATEARADECDLKTWWGSNAHAQQRLLALLFEWKLQQEGREVVLLSGSCNTRFSMKTVVRDARLRTETVQWLTGSVSGMPRGRAVPSRAGLLFDRYSFEHESVETHEKSFLLLHVTSLTAKATTTSKSMCRIERVDATAVHDDLARVLVGPIVGYVDAISAVVLLEVDRVCDLVCVVTNPLTGETMRVFQHFEACRPNSFFLNHLRSEHFYEISLERIQHPDRHCGSLTTMATRPEQLRLLAMSYVEDQVPLKPQTKSLWPWIHENVGSAIPFRGGVDKTIHFEFDSIEEGEARLLKHLASADQHDADCEQLRAKLRDRQRLRWNTPGIRHLLCRGSHLILSESTLVTDEEHGDAKQLQLQQCVEQVHHEYENLLLPPSKRVSSAVERLQKPLSFVFGAFGLFVIPTALTHTTLDDSSLWAKLRAFLRTPGLLAVVLVTRKPVVEDAVEDAEEKARFDSSLTRSLVFQREKLRRLLEILTTWHQQTPLQLDGALPEASQQRSIMFLCGHEWRSFDSVLEDLAVSSSSTSIRPMRIQQFVIGPFHQRPPPTPADLQLRVFPQGSVFGKFGYYHRFQARTIDARLLSGNAREDSGAAKEETTHETLSQLFLLQLSLQPATDDTTKVAVESTFLVSDCVRLTLLPNAAVFDDASAARVRHVDVANREQWTRLPIKQPLWLQYVASQQLSEPEKRTVETLRTVLCEDKAVEVEESFQRAQSLATGLVSAQDRVGFVAQLHAAICDFHKHLAGIAFRAKYPAVPSVYIINYSVEELESSDATAITGAIEMDQYRAILVKSLQNASLFESRLKAFWSPQTSG